MARSPGKIIEMPSNLLGNVHAISRELPGNLCEIPRKKDPGYFQDSSWKFPGHVFNNQGHVLQMYWKLQKHLATVD